MKSIARKTLTSTMGFTWYMTGTWESAVARSEAIGIIDPEKPYAGFAEKTMYRIRLAMVRAGEGLALLVNWFAMRLGYGDGEVSGMVAWPTPAH